jgi:diaminopimelate decarboxylase
LNHALEDALAQVPHRIHYSVKANGNLGILRVLRQLGAAADIVSVGELRRAQAAGFTPDAIVFSGVGKTEAELAEAVRVGVGFVHVESAGELDALLAAARRVGKPVGVGIRVNPDVAADTHPHIRTGEKTAKFGVPFDEVVTLARRLAASRSRACAASRCTSGSQITDAEPYRRGTVKLLELVAAVRASGCRRSSASTWEAGWGAVSPGGAALAQGVRGGRGAPCGRRAQLLLEPGRFLVANAGVLLTRVLYRKHAGGREYVIVDAGMTDFIRPSHYNAHHEIVPLKDGGRPERVVNVVGPVCESGDYLALDRKLPLVEAGEYLAVLGTGAYGFVMSSTYNARPRPPEVIVEGDRWFVARARESLDDLVRGEVAEPVEWQRA